MLAKNKGNIMVTESFNFLLILKGHNNDRLTLGRRKSKQYDGVVTLGVQKFYFSILNIHKMQ